MIIIPLNAVRIAIVYALYSELAFPPFSARRTPDQSVVVYESEPTLLVGCVAGRLDFRDRQVLECLCEHIVELDDIRSTLFINPNPVLHVAAVVLNSSKTLGSDEPIYFYRTCFDRFTCKVIEAVDAERKAVAEKCAILGLTLGELVAVQGAGGLSEAHGASRSFSIYEKLKANERLGKLLTRIGPNSRFLLEDVDYGLITIQSLGRQHGLETRAIDALVDITETYIGQRR